MVCCGLTASLPLVALVPDHPGAPLAVQITALVDDQLSVAELPATMLDGDADNETVATGTGGGGGGGAAVTVT